MVRAREARRHGQAMVEMALGLLLFVTVLIFGIHFAEVGYLTLKVQEAATSALWDTTSAKMHELPGNFKHLENAISKAGQHATERYEDFDGRTSQHGRPKIVQVFTSAEGLSVTCEEEKKISFKPSSSTNSVYENTGGMRCSSKAELMPMRIPEHFLDKGKGNNGNGNGGGGGAIFDVPHYVIGAIPVCGIGRAQQGNGKCRGAYGILLDDWGLAGGEESRECEVLDDDGCDNQAYYRSTKIVYDDHNTANGSAENLAKEVVGTVPISAGKFWMSFRGMDSSFQEKENGGDQD
ncbi:MAG TPA: TadE family protein, partial [Archangium sp.]|uniref:TadE family protein n=1 Tax=Archangium sp. TaxID=1872627 RepID=UPI002EDB74B4